MAPKDPDNKNNSMAVMEMITGVSPGSVPEKQSNVPSGSPKIDVPPGVPNAGPSSGTKNDGGSGNSSMATTEMITGVPSGTLTNTSESNDKSRDEDVAALGEQLGIPLYGAMSGGDYPAAGQPGSTEPSSFMSFTDVLAIVNSGTIDEDSGSIALPSGNNLGWSTDHPSDSVSVRTTQITGSNLSDIEYWQRDERINSPLAGIGGTSYDLTTYSDGRELYKINGSNDFDSMSISADGVVTLAPKDPARSKLSFSILDDQSGLPAEGGNGVTIPTDTLSVNIANWMIASASDGSFATVHNVGVDMANGGTWLDRLAYRKFGNAVDNAIDFTGSYGKGNAITGILTLPLAIHADMQGSSQDSFLRATAREVPAAAVGTAVGTGAGIAAAAAYGALAGSAVPGLGTAIGAIVGAGVGTVVAWKMSEGMDQLLPEFASGGFVSGPGGSTSDSILARLSNGEYVVNAESTRQFGPLLEAINSGNLGGLLESVAPKTDGLPQLPAVDVDSVMSDGAVSGLAGGLSGALSGLENHGLVGGLTGGIKGAASGVGGAIGSGIGAAIGTAVGGPLGSAVGSALGSVVGSEVLGTAAEFITEPLEYAAETAKEVIGTGFGLTDLAEGPGGRTQRGDIYNISGMDPKSVKTAVERVRRRKLVAVSRGGGAK